MDLKPSKELPGVYLTAISLGNKKPARFTDTCMYSYLLPYLGHFNCLQLAQNLPGFFPNLAREPLTTEQLTG